VEDIYTRQRMKRVQDEIRGLVKRFKPSSRTFKGSHTECAGQSIKHVQRKKKNPSFSQPFTQKTGTSAIKLKAVITW